MRKVWLAHGLELTGAQDEWMVGCAITGVDKSARFALASPDAVAARSRLFYHNVHMSMGRITTERHNLAWENFNGVQAEIFNFDSPRFHDKTACVFQATLLLEAKFFNLYNARKFRGENTREVYPHYGGLNRLLAYLQLNKDHEHHLRRWFWLAHKRDLRSAKALINLIAACLLARFGVQAASVQDSLEGDADIHLLVDLEYLHYNPADMGAALMAKVRRELEDNCYYAVKSFTWRGGGPDRTVELKVVIDRETVQDGWQ